MNPYKRSPLTKGSDLMLASSEALRAQLRYEIWEIKRQSEATNEELALELGYRNGSSVTKWLNDHAPVSVDCAKTLDRLGKTPTIGGTFTDLRKAYTQVSRGISREKPRGSRTYDVFLASPMASVEGSEEYEVERQAARDVKEALENYCDLSVYYAGESLESKEEFDSPVVAAEENFDALESAQRFVLLALGKVTRPSSIYVEAGYALARKLPSLYLVRHPVALPFVLRSLNQHERNEKLPTVSVEYVESGARAVGLFRKHGDAIFTRLDGARRVGRRSAPARKSRR